MSDEPQPELPTERAQQRRKRKTAEEDGSGGYIGRGKENKRPKRRRREHAARNGGSRRGPGAPPAPPPPPLPGFDLSARPAFVTESGVKQTLRKNTGLFDSTTANDQYWQFKIATDKSEWVRFFPDSITAQVYGNYDRPAGAAGSGVAGEAAATKWTLRARSRWPSMWIDPSCMATCFVKSVDVVLNGVRVPTNAFNSHLLQYTRMSRIFCDKPGPYLPTNTSINIPADRANMSRAMRMATLAFDYETWNAVNGSRIPVFLDGVFPFDFRNNTLKTIEKEVDRQYYIPPESELIIRVNLWKDKVEGIWHDNCNTLAHYTDAAARTRPTGHLSLTFQNVLCEYETVILTETEHIKAMSDFARGAYASYQYDIPRSQFQSLPAGQTFTENNFQIAPMCQLLYILFLQSEAVMVMETSHKPISGFSKFPINNTRMEISMSGNQLITDSLDHFGMYDEIHQLSKKTFYDYMRERRIYPGSFEEVFPRQADIESINQCLPIDTKHLMSERTSNLRIRMQFAGGAGRASPAGQHILVMSVHPSGRASCHYKGGKYGWEWKFQTEDL